LNNKKSITTNLTKLPLMKFITLLAINFALASSVHAQDVDVYFGTGNQGSRGIYSAVLNTDTGKLKPARLVAEISAPGFLALHPDGTSLYAVYASEEPGVAAFEIKDNGDLNFRNNEPIGDGNAAHISVHPSGKFLLTAQYGGGSITLFPIADDGSVQERSQLVKHQGGSRVIGNRQDSPHPHWVGFSPDGQFAFVPDLGLDQIVIYRVNENEPSLEYHGIAQSLPGGGPRHMRFSNNGHYIYLLNELSLSVTTFSYDDVQGTGKRLTTTPSLSDAVKSKEAFNSASEILVHPNGEFVYSGNRGHDSVTVYQADPATGQLIVQEVEPVRGSWPRNINLDPAGKWLLAAGAHSNTISVFAIDPENGELTFQTKNVISVPNPICILFRK
jgi:6-phosphogluconolactonase